MRYIFNINLVQKSIMEVAIKSLYDWLERNKPDDPTLNVSVLQTISDYDKYEGNADESSDDSEGVNCTEQTYDLEQIYDNYVLVHSKNNSETMKYVPLIDRIIAWMDLTYGFN